MSLEAVYPAFPALARGSACPLKVDKTGKKLLFPHDRQVIIRDIDPAQGKPIAVQLYKDHGYPVTAATMAPSGCYVASGDNKGTVRIWACDNPDQILKLETPLFAGQVLDIAWSADSQRLIGVGAGANSFGKVIMWDSGNSVGEIGGHTKQINSCAFKTTRPFRIATGGEEGKVNFYEGPPFKFKATPKTHERFVNTVRFSPDGARFFSSSSDASVAVYDGKEGTLIIEKKVHAGSIFDACWSPDSTKILTASGDGSAKVLDAATLDEVNMFNFKSGDRKKTVSEQQVGCAWGTDAIVSYSLGGVMSIFRSPTDTAPAVSQYGHHKPINALVFDRQRGVMYSGGFDDATGTLRGVVNAWDPSTGLAQPFTGEGPTNNVVGLGVCGGLVVSCSSDDAVIVSDGTSRVFGDKIALGACPKGFSCGGASLAAAVTTTDNVVVISVADKKVVCTKKLGYSAECVAVSEDDSLLAVGGDDNDVHVLGPDGSEKHCLKQHKGAISCVAFAPGGARLASGCANKEVVVWDPKTGVKLVAGLSGYHTARLSTLAWTPDGVTLASGGVDASIIVWDLEAKKAKSTIKLAHTGGAIRGLTFASPTELYSTGGDACIKKWKLVEDIS